MRQYIILSIVCIFYVAAYGYESKFDKILESFRNLPNEKLAALADSYYKKNIQDSALVCYTIICNNYNLKASKKDKKIFAYSYSRSGEIYYMMYNYVQAQDMYLKSLEICEESGCKEYIPRVYNGLGSIYASFSDYNMAKSYYQKALTHSMENHDTSLTLAILDNLIGTSSNTGNHQQIYHYINLRDSITGYKGDGLTSLTARATIATQNQDFDTALKYAKKAYRLTDSLQLAPKFQCSSLNNLASAFHDVHKNDSALHYWFLSEKIAKFNGLLDMQTFIYNELAKIGYETKNEKMFSHYSMLYRTIEDSIFSIKRYHSIKGVELLFEMNRLDKQIELMKTDQKIKDVQLSHQRLIILIVSCILILIVVFLFVTYKQKKKLQVSYKDIFNKNIEIIASEKEVKQRYLKYEQELREKDEYISRIMNDKPDLKMEQETVSLVNAGKYQNSSLNDKQRTALINAINHVMESTLEFCNAEFTLERMAELVNSKSKYVSQAINETYGKNFNRFINEYRIKEARRRLTNIDEYGQYTLKAVSQSVGFKSSSNFNLLFKEITGITPSMYQNMILNS